MGHPKHKPATELEKRAQRIHCMLGFPLDMATMDDVLSKISEATRKRRRLFISTVNLNFVTLAHNDDDFRDSLRSSDLCVADGIAVKLIGGLLGLPIPERVAGSDILSAIWEKSSNPQEPPLKVFFFGGTEKAGQLACDAVNRHPSANIVCVGNLYPSYGSVEDMSSDAILEKINHAKPDFLIVALGARKGQAWIMHNKDKLEVPVISHLGATINFIAGTVKRAPKFWQRAGLEWLWRIKEEPELAKRYLDDALTLLKLLVSRIGPMTIWFLWGRCWWGSSGLSVEQIPSNNQTVRWALVGAVAGGNVDMLARTLGAGTTKGEDIDCDVGQVAWADTAAMGNLLLLSEHARKNNGKFRLVRAGTSLQIALKLNGLDHVLAED